MNTEQTSKNIFTLSILILVPITNVLTSNSFSYVIGIKVLFNKSIFLEEGNYITGDMTNPWKETTLQTILINLTNVDTYNAN